MRILPLIALGAALVAAPAAAVAPKKAPAKAPVAATAQTPPPEVEHAMFYLKVLISALQSDKVEQPVKGALVGCIYNNSLSKITDSMDKVIAENAGKISRDDPNQVLSAMVAICGYKPVGAAPAAATPQGR